MATAAERGKAEAAARDTSVVYDTVTWDDYKWEVLPARKWRSSAIHALTNNHYEVWAAACLSATSYAHWREVDPTVDECDEFWTAWKDRTGQDPGESSAS